MVIVKRCIPHGTKCTPNRPFVKKYIQRKANKLCGDHFRITVEPVIIKRYRRTLVNRDFYKKKPSTRFDTHGIETGVRLWHSEQPLRKHKYFLADGTTMDCIISRFCDSPTTRYSRCRPADMHPFRNAAGTLKKRPQDFSRGHFVIPSSMTAAQLFGPAPLRCCHP